MSSYSQVKAMLAITKATLKSIFRSPSAVVFSFVFPFIFILVFGFVGGRGGVPVYKLALASDCDTNNVLFDSIKASKRVKIVYFADTSVLRSSLVKGRIAGILNINKTNTSIPEYGYSIRTSTASADQWPQLIPV